MRILSFLFILAVLSIGLIGAMAIMDIVIGRLKESTAMVDATGPGTRELDVSDIGDMNYILTYDSDSGNFTLITEVGNGSIIIRVPPGICLAFRNDTWATLMCNDGSDGYDIVVPYREFSLAPGVYEWRQVTRESITAPIYTVLKPLVPFVVLTFLSIMVIMLIYTKRR